MLGTRNPAVLAHLANWGASGVMAVHNFSDAPARATVRPASATPGRWKHIFGTSGTDVPALRDGRLSCEIPPYGYHWFGRQEGV